jgi:hypothetical protein
MGCSGELTEPLKYLSLRGKSLRTIRSQDKSTVRLHPPSTGFPGVRPPRLFDRATWDLPGQIYPSQAHKGVCFRQLLCLAIAGMQGTRTFDLMADEDRTSGVGNQTGAALA